MAEPFWREDRQAWYFLFKDADGKWRQRRGGRSKQEAWAALIQIERDLQPVRLGLVDPKQHRLAQQGKAPIGEVLVEFEAHLRGQRAGEQHVKTTIGDVATIFGVPDPDPTRQKRREHARTDGRGYKAKPCPWSTLADIDAAEFSAFLDRVAAVRSANRRNRYRASLVQLVRWAMSTGKLGHNPIAMVKALDEQRHARRIRRAMSRDEVLWLTAHVGKLKRGGAMRALYYWLAFGAGLRWSEIGRLERRHIDLENGCLLLTADITKSGRDDVVPLLPSLVTDLETSLSGIVAGRIFTGSPTRLTWRRDLKRARTAWVAIDPDNRAETEFLAYTAGAGCAYRGAARTTFGTLLYEAGVDLRTAQELMRHTDPKLTAKVYQRVRLHHTRAGIDALAAAITPGTPGTPGATSTHDGTQKADSRRKTG